MTSASLLRFGDRDHFGQTAVEAWQKNLARLGYPPGPSDGAFGHGTEQATEDLQRAAGLRVDGVVGPETRAAAERLEAELLPGIDVSHYQGRIDWQAVARAGIRFVYIKASEGRAITDDRFAENWAEARAAGLRVGAYHYLDKIGSAAEQAARFLAVYRHEADALPPALDLEEAGAGETREQLSTRALEWVRVVELALGVEVIVYCSPSFAADHLGGPGLVELGKRGLWLAHYDDAPTVPSPWPSWRFWQHSGTGTVNGIAGHVDLNWMRPPLP